MPRRLSSSRSRLRTAPLLLRKPGDVFVRDVVAEDGVEAEHAQQAREPAEVGVCDEACIRQRPLGSAVQHLAAATCEAGIHDHTVPVTHRPGQIRWFAVHQDYADFGVRDPERLDRVLHCRRPRTAIDDVAIALPAREELVQLPVEAKRRDSMLHRLTHPG